MSLLAEVNVGAQLALQSVTFRPKRKFGAFEAQVTIEESHRDEMTITSHPVENNAAISDHAFRQPAELTIRCAWSNSPSASGYVAGIVAAAKGTVNSVQSLISGNSESQVRAVYSKLLDLLQSRTLITIYTGKRNYDDMLLQSLSTSTTQETENSLIVTARFQQIIITSTRVVAVSSPQSAQKNPGSTNPVYDFGTKMLQSTSRLPSYFQFIPQ